MRIRKTLFDRKFGDNFIKGVPLCPGIYEMLNTEGQTIYVGKAKLLRRRLQQYRNARRCKKHHKMRAILTAAHAIRVTPCESDLNALLLENETIQNLRPQFNIAGAFSFLYPSIGLQRLDRSLYLCYTTSPQEFSSFEFYGAYRSREISWAGFGALLEILEFIGHREPPKKLVAYPRIRFSSLAGFRQIDDFWIPLIEAFLKGESREFLEKSVIALIEKPYARRHAAATQELIDEADRFFRFEAKALNKALKDSGSTGHSIAQEDRDGVFLRARHTRKSPAQRSRSRHLDGVT